MAPTVKRRKTLPGGSVEYTLDFRPSSPQKRGRKTRKKATQAFPQPAAASVPAAAPNPQTRARTRSQAASTSASQPPTTPPPHESLGTAVATTLAESLTSDPPSPTTRRPGVARVRFLEPEAESSNQRPPMTTGDVEDEVEPDPMLPEPSHHTTTAEEQTNDPSAGTTRSPITESFAQQIPRSPTPDSIFAPNSASPQHSHSGGTVEYNDDEWVDIEVPRSRSPPPIPSRNPSHMTPPRRTPSTPRGLPRCGPHSINRHSQLSAVRLIRQRENARRNGKKDKIPDLTPFYVRGDGDNASYTCLFCQFRHATGASQDSPTTYSSTTSTGIRREHLCEKHPNEWIKSCDSLDITIPLKNPAVIEAVDRYRQTHGQDDPTSGSQGSGQRQPFTQDAFIEKLVDWIVSDDQSFNVVENKKLRDIFLLLRKELNDGDIPHRNTVRRKVIETWKTHIKSLGDEMKKALGRISTTTDIWTDPFMKAYMAVTAHWIESALVKGEIQLRIRSELVGFVPMPENHTGEHLAHAFIQVLNRYEITPQLGWITTDNASNNARMIECMKNLLQTRNITAQFSHSRHIRCFPHIINLACKAVIEDIKNVEFLVSLGDVEGTIDRDAIEALRNIIRYIRSSSLRRASFSTKVLETIKKDLQLLRDIDIRWSSTLLMLERALMLQVAINEWLVDESMGGDYNTIPEALNQAEWRAIEIWAKILKVPHLFQHLLSSEQTPTLMFTLRAFENCIGLWESLQKEFPEAEASIQLGIDKLKEYSLRAGFRELPAHTLAMLLDPNQKLEWFERHRPHELVSVKSWFAGQLRPYHKPVEQEPSGVNEGSTAAEEELDPDARAYAAAARMLNLDHSAGTAASGSSSSSLLDEVRAYLNDGSRHKGCLLGYWQMNRQRYPTLFAMAMDIIPIQSSAVPCERIFSSAKETTTMRRNRLGADTMEACQMLKFASKQGDKRGESVLNFTSAFRLSEESRELEELQQAMLAVPGDMRGFIESLSTV